MSKGKRVLAIPDWIFEVSKLSKLSSADLRHMLGGLSQAGFHDWLASTDDFPKPMKQRRGGGLCEKRVWNVGDVIAWDRRQKRQAAK